MKRPNPLAIGERVRDGRVHHKWMTRLLEENFGIKKQSGETLSLVNPISPYTYWGFMRKNGGERRHTRLSINPGDYVFESQERNSSRNKKHWVMLYEAGCIDSEGEAVEELWPLEKQLPFDEFKPSFWVESDLVRYLQMSIEEINLFYGPRGFTEEARVQRAEIDEKLLQLQERGQNMSEIARLLGFGIEKSRKCRAMRNALKRARAARGGENETKQPQGKGDKGLSQS